MDMNKSENPIAENELKNFDFLPVLLQLVSRWRMFLIHGIIATVIAGVYAFGIQRVQFQSTTTFLPPKDNMPKLSSVASGLLGVALGGQDFSPETVIAIFESDQFKLDVIQQFNLIEKYKLDEAKNQKKKAMRILAKDLLIDTWEKGSLGVTTVLGFSLEAYHENPDTACLMAKYAFQKLDSAVIAITSSEAKRTGDFIALELQERKDTLDSISKVFVAFQKEHNLFDLPTQLESLVEQYGVLNAEYIANDLQIQQLRRVNYDSHSSIRTLKTRNRIIKKQLAEITGDVEKSDAFLSFAKTADLAPQYFTYLRELEVLNKVIIYLTQMKEEARIDQSNTTTRLVSIDPPRVQEYKVRPKRLFTLVVYGSLYMFIVFLFVGLQLFYQFVIKRSPLYHALKETV